MRFKNVFNIVNCHAEGGIGHVLTGGMPSIPGDTVLEKKEYFEKNLDWIRTMLLLEPRGGLIHSVNIIVPSTDPRAAFGYLICETTQLPEMSGGNTMCVATVLVETGMVEMVEPVTHLILESAAGLIELDCTCRDGKVTGVTITNQPAFVYQRDVIIDVPTIGKLRIDVAWGGMAYAIAIANDVGLTLTPGEDAEIVRLGELVKAAAAEQLEAVHPENPDFAGITQTMFTGPIKRDGRVLKSRSAVIVSPGYIDRCACGTGTSARLALLHERGEIEVGQHLIAQSVSGTTFDSWIESTSAVGPYAAVIPKFTGQAYITGLQQVGVDPADPFPEGFSMATLADGSVRTKLPALF